MELVDLLNNRKELIGEVCERNAVPDGKYRLSVHIWIVNDKNEILIQQRSANKKSFLICGRIQEVPVSQVKLALKRFLEN